eukprot:CAMPEP_0197620142 /NCGR_PEP_ID=MMETSP1338-20131121/1008_1 /TAXON_ID=43686 ORGANISM="Pelagodinium beii, Strain RCC1491" /NCGR_SAMPLE_ID=MMETSP1338 /ASSEMBLY_ACC=CAM_ASM_000754 /LENGTH=398 /DNA_ID=CAMNT_0043189235 /DNA_START=90 /DNA_END=1286 /DNA_ORIENTATION=-
MTRPQTADAPDMLDSKMPRLIDEATRPQTAAAPGLSGAPLWEFTGLQDEESNPNHREQHQKFWATVKNPLHKWTPRRFGETGSRASTAMPRSRAASSIKPESSAASATSKEQPEIPPPLERRSLAAQRAPHSARASMRESIARLSAVAHLDTYQTARLASHEGEVWHISVRLPADHMTGFLVAPTTRVGPQKRKPDVFADFWGDGVEERGPLCGRIPPGKTKPLNRRLTPVRLLLAQRMGSSIDEFDLQSQVSKIKSLDAVNLKELIEIATGIPIGKQVVCFGTRGALNDEDTLEYSGLQDGAVVKLRLKTRWKPGKEEETQAIIAGDEKLSQQAEVSWQIAPPSPPWNVRQPHTRVREFNVANPRFAPHLEVNSWKQTRSTLDSQTATWREMKTPPV